MSLPMANFMTIAALLKTNIYDKIQIKLKAFLPLRTPGASPQAKC